MSELVRALLEPTGPLALLDLFDALRLAGRLEEALEELALHRAASPLVGSLLPYARPQAHAPLVVGHRGDPTSFVENTLPGISSAFRLGADAVELDVLLVKDGDGHEVICRHDPTPGGCDVPGFYATIRNLGLEPRVYADDLFLARPTTPPVWRRSLRRVSHELTLEEYRAHYGYAPVASWPMTATPLEATIPTLAEVTRLVAAERPDGLLFLDTRVPAGRPDLRRAMAERIASAVEGAGLDPARIIVGNADAEALGGLRELLGPRYRYTLDEMLVGPFAKAETTSAHARATSFGAEVGDVGHVFFGSDDTLLAVAERDIPAMSRDGRLLVLWTINDELLFRKLLGIGGRTGGGFDLVITDRPAAFRARLDRMGLPRRAWPGTSPGDRGARATPDPA